MKRLLFLVCIPLVILALLMVLSSLLSADLGGMGVHLGGAVCQ